MNVTSEMYRGWVFHEPDSGLFLRSSLRSATARGSCRSGRGESSSRRRGRWSYQPATGSIRKLGIGAKQAAQCGAGLAPRKIGRSRLGSFTSPTLCKSLQAAGQQTFAKIRPAKVLNNSCKTNNQRFSKTDGLCRPYRMPVVNNHPSVPPPGVPFGGSRNTRNTRNTFSG